MDIYDNMKASGVENKKATADVLFETAQNIANCTFLPIEQKKLVRRMILETVVLGIQEYRSNNFILEEIRSAAKQ
jgi:hypothetical protein